MDSRDRFICWMNERGTVEALTLWFAFLMLLFMVAVVLSRPVDAAPVGGLSGEIHMISRYDCSVWSSRACGVRGLKSVYGYSLDGKVCRWGCTLTAQQRIVFGEVLGQVRLFNYYTLGGLRNGLE